MRLPSAIPSAASASSAHMNRPWAMIASAGSNGLAVPLPSASTAHVGQVPARYRA
ncbi:hypothetical protein [Frankia sp. Cj5]|uniref:hypothetical protein n=1 Tax=Frankia sp. Cj5 TaxID=2880978 RepID=UPI001EF5EE3F|nr:hypothetical protein [Frankia sp. Cj5]